MVRAWRLSWGKDPVLDHRVEEHCGQSGLSRGYPDGWVRCVWRHYRGILTAYVYCRIKNLDFLRFFDTLMPSVALAQGFGRIGCLLAGCCYGKETNSAFSITFHDSGFAPNGVALIPTQIYSSILDFIHYGILLFILKKQKKDGETAAAYLIFYSAGRFVLEFFRGDLARGSVGALSTSQFISLFTFVAGIVLLLVFSENARDGKTKRDMSA